jgi:hypothetical protein
VWIAPDEVGGELTPFPAGFDHLRSIPVRLPAAENAEPVTQREAATR